MNRMTAQELKDCPFCGKQPRVTYHGGSDAYKVECNWYCPSKTSSQVKDLAIKAWNTRFPTIPEGYILVPVGPTVKMLLAGDGVIGEWKYRVVADIWADMIAAAQDMQ